MRQLKARLKNRLKAAKRIAFVGVGSELHGDDAAGMLVARQIKDFASCKKTSVKFKVFLGHTAPENLTGQIKKFKPTHIVILDAADMKKKPGEAYLVDFAEESGITFSTHRMPAKILSDYLCQSLACQAMLVGIQPKSIEFNKPVSREVQTVCKKLVACLREAVNW